MLLVCGFIVFAFAFALIALAVTIVIDPERAKSFLRLFASSAKAHYIEQVSRLVIGIALVVFSPCMWLSAFFVVLGWLIVVTAIALMLIPWQWHHRFGQWAIPLVIRHLRLYGLLAFVLGIVTLIAALRVITA